MLIQHSARVSTRPAQKLLCSKPSADCLSYDLNRWKKIHKLSNTNGWTKLWATSRDFRKNVQVDERFFAEHNGVVHTFVEMEFLELFGKQITRFCSAVRIPLSIDQISRIGLTVSQEDNDKHGFVTKEDWNIVEIWLSSGGDGEVSGCYYGRHEGGQKYMINLYTLGIEKKDCVGVPEVIMEGIDDDDGNVEFWHGSQSPEETVMEIDAWCSANIGRHMIMSHAGSRGSSSKLKNYYAEPKIPFRDDSRECLRFALLNAIHLVVGNNSGRKVMKWFAELDVTSMRDVGCKRRVRGLRDLQKQLNEVMPRCVLRHVKHELNLNTIASLTEGVFLAVLVGICKHDGSTILHCVCIDADNGLVYDCTEKHAIRLSSITLGFCVGDDQRYGKVEEMRRLDWIGKKASCLSNRKRRAAARLEEYKKCKKSSG